jgi:hypothetical protein
MTKKEHFWLHESLFCSSFEEEFAEGFAEGYAKGVAEKAVECLASYVTYVTAAALTAGLGNDLANFLDLKEIFTALAKEAVSKGFNEGKLIAFVVLKNGGYPNIKLGDGSEVSDENIIRLEKIFYKKYK